MLAEEPDYPKEDAVLENACGVFATVGDNQAQRIYPYLLRSLTIGQPNQVLAMDTTYIPLSRGFVYLTAMLDWATRRALAWRLSNSLTPDACVDVLEEPSMMHGAPEIMNTDQAANLPARPSSAYSNR